MQTQEEVVVIAYELQSEITAIIAQWHSQGWRVRGIRLGGANYDKRIPPDDLLITFVKDAPDEEPTP